MKKLALGLIVTTILVVGILFSTAYLSALIESEPDSLAAGHKSFAAKDFRQALVHYRKAARIFGLQEESRRIHSVLAGQPAAAAGLRPGDAILRIGRHATQLVSKLV